MGLSVVFGRVADCSVYRELPEERPAGCRVVRGVAPPPASIPFATRRSPPSISGGCEGGRKNTKSSGAGREEPVGGKNRWKGRAGGRESPVGGKSRTARGSRQEPEPEGAAAGMAAVPRHT